MQNTVEQFTSEVDFIDMGERPARLIRKTANHVIDGVSAGLLGLWRLRHTGNLPKNLTGRNEESVKL
jgi:hypothetical protein